MEDAPKHSGIGIASLVMAALSGFAFIAVVVIAGVLESTTPGGLSEDSTEALLVGLGAFGTMGLDALALCLSVAALLQRDRHKLFPALGFVASALVLLGIGGVFLLSFFTA